jgi:TRAP-type uncharacterized transport system substrate-binding protein
MTLRIGTSAAGGTFYTQGEAILELLNCERLAGEVRMVETRLVSVDNANRVDTGEIK